MDKSFDICTKLGHNFEEDRGLCFEKKNKLRRISVLAKKTALCKLKNKIKKYFF